MTAKQVTAQTITVHGSNCIGCRDHKREVMVAVGSSPFPTRGIVVDDTFLTNEQALKLAEDLVAVVERNKMLQSFVEADEQESRDVEHGAEV